ncbi:DUF2585 protein [Fadolivirus algeromassiliense]|jgi:hypothetical protein|uniref:DUF2585 protein n=1 Tax=Fadolivirus FV1/VV64 TaxID=3070911 RepID=A0A7D3UQF8_9VIRU|nr:DUF2585 protein [Fadolivirus algeromassiliense]QKF93753.1 DUF2585 protein [Fadolivirus FV1/VV64]
MNDKTIKRLFVCDQPHKHWYEYIYNIYHLDSPHNSKHLFDIYSLTHIFWPMLIVLVTNNIFNNNILIPIIIAIFVTYFEKHENSTEQIIKYRRIEIDSNGKSTYRGDSLINVLGDMFINLFAIYIAYNSSNIENITILIIIFLVITNIAGLSYWTDFYSFMS